MRWDAELEGMLGGKELEGTSGSYLTRVAFLFGDGITCGDLNGT